MLTKGIVEELITQYSAKVRLPIFDKSAEAKNATSTENLSTAIICSLPNTENSINVDDIVIVGFEDNDMSKPIILGQLIRESGNDTYVDINARKLKTLSTTSLYKDTYIGDIKPSEIACLANVSDNIQSQIDLIKTYTYNDVCIGQWLDGKKVYRKVINKTHFDLQTNVDTLIGNISGNIDSVIDIKQTSTYNNSAYDLYYNTNSRHTIIGCRVDLTTGNVYACAVDDSWIDTHLIVIIEYTLNEEE